MRRVLAIGAHPDDVEIGCGGTLLRHRAAGDSVDLLVLSQGELGGDPALRGAEAQQAAGRLGAGLLLHDFPDAAMPDGPNLIVAIEAAVARIAPTQIYIHSVHDAHQDHRAAHRAAIVAGRGVNNIACYQSPSTTVEFQPRMFVEIGDHFEAKLALIACHTSQVRDRVNIEADLIRATARYWGRFAGYGLAEPFEIVRQTGFV